VLEAQNTKGGISRTAPRQPKPPVHSLPPILSEVSRTPISSCSKGSRGLSVLPQVLGIFTETLISPSPSLRQRPSRYAIRAGRNFTDPTVSDGGRLSLHLAEALRSATSIALLDRQLHRLSFVVRAGVLPATHARDEPLLSDQSLRGHEDFPRDHHLAEPGRLPRYEPALGCSLRNSGASCLLPDKEFRYLRHVCYLSTEVERLGRFSSAQLSMSPWRSDHLFTPATECLAYGL
jgi:hypothetical protein